ncbi:hypothetical protein K439DRAFT_1230478, partial [Ramaria rubella]
DGWFRKISSQWPEAITLKVLHVLHVQKNEFQDVLVFASETSGNVLVFDGVIQCIECCHAGTQEMIAHILLASHPHPKKVLVIGGGHGGVCGRGAQAPVRRAGRLWDIHDAVVRVAKLYLLHMAVLLASPRVHVH